MSYARGSKPRNPTIYNVTMTLADTEYSQQLSQYTKAFDIHTRDESAFRLAFEPLHVATPIPPYWTVVQNTRYFPIDLDVYVKEDTDWDGTLYFASDDAGKVIEIIEWI